MSEFDSTQHGTQIGYRVQARCAGKHTPHAKLGPYIITKEWTTLDFPKGTAGVPTGNYYPLADDAGFLGYAAACALMAWAAAFVSLDGAGFEFRLVKVELTYEWKTRPLGYGAPRNLFEESHNADYGSHA